MLFSSLNLSPRRKAADNASGTAPQEAEKGMSRRSFLLRIGGGAAVLAAGAPRLAKAAAVTRDPRIAGLSNFFEADLTSLTVARADVVAHLCGPKGRSAASSLRAAINLLETQALTGTGSMQAALASADALRTATFGEAIVADREILSGLSRVWSEHLEFARALGVSQSGEAIAIPFANLSAEAQQAFALKVFRSASRNVTFSRASELRIVEVLAKRGDSTVKALLRRARAVPEEQLLAFADGPEMRAAQRLAGALEDLSQLSPSSPEYRKAHHQAQAAVDDLEAAGIQADARMQRQFSLTSGRGQRMLIQLDPFTMVNLLTRHNPIEFFHGESHTWIRARGEDRELSARLHHFFKRCNLPNRYVQLEQGLSAGDVKRKILGVDRC